MKNFLRFCLPVALLFSVVLVKAQSGKKPSVLMNHVAVYVVDLEKSTHFYRDLVGLDTMPEPFHDGKHAWFRVGENCHLHVISGAKEATTHDKNAHICFSVASVDDFLKKLQKENIEFESWPGEKGKYAVRVDGVKQLYLKDPDGYWIEINDAKY
ncbi:VOC family protein [Danxiaibacter flavus]|uniref:VOC family protein n=1 Tax=Danxiaibacter flavus TaxID=3049108 RepID=A0ABV3ZNL7_9BACT|nr:VOC family protein [Chitinophagaceae bacterium DXS]